jgi:hypothetical protein
MRLKLLFTLGLVLFLSTLASSNECARHEHKAGSKAVTHVAPENNEYSTLVINKLLYI